jgi:hypothetical protein
LNGTQNFRGYFLRIFKKLVGEITFGKAGMEGVVARDFQHEEVRALNDLLH